MRDQYAWNAWMGRQPASWLIAGFTLFLGAVWFMAHPYMGLWHDTRLYAVDALALLRPDIYDRDLFLAFGSQGEFTLFPRIFAWLISQLGLDDATLALALTGKLLWFVSLVSLARRLEPSWAWVLGLLLVLVYPAYYDSHKIFSYGESFATPRIYAEALSMLALVAWLRSKPALAWLLVVLAGLLHPLMAISVASLLGLLACTVQRQSAWAVWPMIAGALGTGVALLWIPDLHQRLISTYDPAWLEAVRLRNPYVFLDQWNDDAFGGMVWVGVILGLCALRMQTAIARVSGAALATTIVLVVLAWVGTSVWDNVLLTQLQLWRGMWLAQLLALLLLGGLLPRLWQSDYPDRVLAASLVAAILAYGWMSGFIAVAGVILMRIFRRAGARVDTASSPWKALPFLLVLPGTVAHFLALPYWFQFNELTTGTPIWRTLAGGDSVVLALAAAFYWAAWKGGARTAKWLGRLGAAAMLVAVFTWAAYDRGYALTSREPVYAQLRDRIPPGSVVAAPVAGTPALIWFDLHRASYVSQLQTAGSLFSRDTALEGLRRLKQMQAAGLPYSSLAWGDTRPAQSNQPSAQSVKLLCNDPDLDFVILSGARDGAEKYSRLGHVALSLYACSDLRKS